MEKCKAIKESSRFRFERALKGRVKGRKTKHWNGGYAFAASREWRIKTAEQLDAALEVEYERFSNALEESLEWMRNGGLDLGERIFERRAEITIPALACRVASDLCEPLEVEDEGHLCLGGGPNKDLRCAFLSLYLEVEPDEIATTRLEKCRGT